MKFSLWESHTETISPSGKYDCHSRKDKVYIQYDIHFIWKFKSFYYCSCYYCSCSESVSAFVVSNGPKVSISPESIFLLSSSSQAITSRVIYGASSLPHNSSLCSGVRESIYIQYPVCESFLSSSRLRRWCAGVITKIFCYYKRISICF